MMFHYGNLLEANKYIQDLSNIEDGAFCENS